jgi:hypothetical protein
LAFLIIRAGRSVFYRLATSSTGVLNVMLGDYSDEQKLELLQKRTVQLILSLLGFVLLLVIAFSVVAGFVYGYAHWFATGSISEPSWSTGPGILSISVGATLPFLLPKTKSASGYSELAKLLHRMVLSNYHLGFKLFQRESAKAIKKGPLPKYKFLIVSGLARAGTTSLMNQIAEEKSFRSLNYSQMPFLLSPNLWSRFYPAKSSKTKERSHKDGILIGMDSNEALEEYFFKVLKNDDYIFENHLQEHQISLEQQQRYLLYQSLVRQEEAEIYLAKNNNFLLRYKSLRSLNPHFVLALLFRSPLHPAASLREKHREYCLLQQEDSFILEYMDWLGHHEFGLGQKPFLFEGNSIPEGNKEDLDYWLRLWLMYYEYALKQDHSKVVFIDYDTFCLHPNLQIERVLSEMELSLPSKKHPSFTNKRSIEAVCDAALLEEAESVFRKLLQKSILP